MGACPSCCPAARPLARWSRPATPPEDCGVALRRNGLRLDLATKTGGQREPTARRACYGLRRGGLASRGRPSPRGGTMSPPPPPPPPPPLARPRPPISLKRPRHTSLTLWYRAPRNRVREPAAPP